MPKRSRRFVESFTAHQYWQKPGCAQQPGFLLLERGFEPDLLIEGGPLAFRGQRPPGSRALLANAKAFQTLCRQMRPERIRALAVRRKTRSEVEGKAMSRDGLDNPARPASSETTTPGTHRRPGVVLGKEAR